VVHSSQNFALIHQHFKLFFGQFTLLYFFYSPDLFGFLVKGAIDLAIGAASDHFDEFIVLSDGILLLGDKLKWINRYLFEGWSFYFHPI